MVGTACCLTQPGFSAATTFRIGHRNGLSTASEREQTWFELSQICLTIGGVSMSHRLTGKLETRHDPFRLF
jgi:hypothetical protein